MMTAKARQAGLLVLIVLFMAPTPGWSSVLVSSVGALQSAVDSANSGGDPTILIADGTYDLSGVALMITADGVTVRSASGNRGAVVLDNHYVEGGTSGIFRILASGVTIADLTLQRPYYHAIHISPAAGRSTQNILIQNVHIIDPGEQAIKINPDDPDAATYTVDNSTIKNCLIELTDAGRTQLTSDYPCYTGGIDGHWAANWKVQDNVVRGFWCSDALSEHGIHFWNNSSNILVERNKIIDCDRGIGFGLGERGNTGGIIRNNMIYHGPDHGQSDVGIGVESTPSAQVYNNTIYHEHAYRAIEYRYGATTDILIANNLTNREIFIDDEISGTVTNNLATAQASWFVNTGAGDLHLASAVASVVDQGMAVSGLTDDFDKGARPYGAGYDIGADEFGAGPPAPPPPPPEVPEGVNMAPVLHLLRERDEREVLHEDFESWPPAGWTVIDNGGDCVWDTNVATGRPNYAGGDGMAATANSFECLSGARTMNTDLLSPLFDLSMAEEATLSYIAAYYDWSANDYAEVSISTDGGTSWAPLLRWEEDHSPYGPAGEAVTLDLTPYTGTIQARLRFHYYGVYDWWWMIDQVRVTRE